MNIKFKDLVKIKKGFYGGCIGTVEDITLSENPLAFADYYVKINVLNRRELITKTVKIPESNLELIKSAGFLNEKSIINTKNWR